MFGDTFCFCRPEWEKMLVTCHAMNVKYHLIPHPFRCVIISSPLTAAPIKTPYTTSFQRGSIANTVTERIMLTSIRLPQWSMLGGRPARRLKDNYFVMLYSKIGGPFQYEDHLSMCMCFQIRRSWDRRISTMGIPILVRRVFISR